MSSVKVTLKDRRTERSYEGDFVTAVTVSNNPDGEVSARVVFSPTEVKTGLGLFVAGVEILQTLVNLGVEGPHVEAAKLALQAIDDNDPSKTCPFCHRKPRKDSDKAVWTKDHVLVACERCVIKMSREELAAAVAARL